VVLNLKILSLINWFTALKRAIILNTCLNKNWLCGTNFVISVFNNGPTVNLESFKDDLRTLIEEYGNKRLAKDLIDYAKTVGDDITRNTMDEFVTEMTLKKNNKLKP
jgi:hypothetical protein